MKRKVFLAVFLIPILVAGLLMRKVFWPKPSHAPIGGEAAMSKKATILCCWYVVHDDAGRSGYACANGRFSFTPPGGHYGLFSTLTEFAKRVKGWRERGDDGIVIIPEFGGHVPSGWEIRSLDANERDALGKAVPVEGADEMS